MRLVVGLISLRVLRTLWIPWRAGASLLPREDVAVGGLA